MSPCDATRLPSSPLRPRPCRRACPSSPAPPRDGPHGPAASLQGSLGPRIPPGGRPSGACEPGPGPGLAPPAPRPPPPGGPRATLTARAAGRRPRRTAAGALTSAYATAGAATSARTAGGAGCVCLKKKKEGIGVGLVLVFFFFLFCLVPGAPRPPLRRLGPVGGAARPGVPAERPRPGPGEASAPQGRQPARSAGGARRCGPAGAAGLCGLVRLSRTRAARPSAVDNEFAFPRGDSRRIREPRGGK